MVLVDRENIPAPDKTLALADAIGPRKHSTGSFRRLNSLATQAPSVPASKWNAEMATLRAIVDIPSDSPAVGNISVGIYEGGLQSMEARIPFSKFPIHVLNLPTDSPGHICESLARLLVLLFEIQRREAVEALPVLGCNHIQEESPSRIFRERG